MTLSFYMISAVALANGGPDDWTHPTPLGSARAQGTVGTRLVSEDLAVTFRDDYDTVNAVATYQLHNPGAAETVRYAVPVLDELYPSELTAPSDPATKIRLTLDGTPVPCRVEALTPTRTLVHPQQRRISPGALDVDPGVPVYENRDTEFEVGSICVAHLALPSGDSTLVLEVEEEPLHHSFSTSKDKHAGTSDRRWVWLLSPAASWAGVVDTLRVDLDLGPYASTATVHGEGWSRDGAHARRTLRRVDLATQPPLQVDLGVEEMDFQKVILATSARNATWEAISARASSVLGDQRGNRYGASALVDKDPRTAWCEGVDGVGIGEWVELTYSPIQTTDGRRSALLAPEYISLQMAIVPGYAKSDGTWTQNGRVAEVQVSACDGSTPATVALPPRSDPRSALFLTGFGGNLYAPRSDLPGVATAITSRWSDSGEPACIRLTITRVRPGSHFADTCISELAYLIDAPG